MTHTTRPTRNKSKGHHTGPAVYSMVRSRTKRERLPASAYHLTSGRTCGVEAVPKIRTPHPNDILCGRGGFVNNHPGNKIFREWVHERKNRYNLAVRKSEKARISHEIINLVQSLDPPGRFLREDPDQKKGKILWVEIDDVKAMTKTSQALREGAPGIRAMLGVRRGSRGSLRNAYRKEPPVAASTPPPWAPVLPDGPSAAHHPPSYVAAALKQYQAQLESAMAPHQSASAYFEPVYNMMNANKLGRNVKDAVSYPMQSNGDLCVSSFPLPYYSKPMHWSSRWE